MDNIPRTEEHAAERWLVSALKPVRQPLLLSIAAALLAVVLAAVQARVLATACHRAVIDGVAAAAIKPLALYLLLFALLRAVLAFLAERQGSRAAAALKAEVRSRLYRRIHTGQAAGRAADSGALIEAVTHGVDSLEPYVARFIPHLAIAALFPPLCMLLLFPLDWRSGAVLLFSAPFIPLFMILIGKGAQSLNRQQWSRLAVMSGHLLDLIRGLPDLKICSAARREAAAVAKVSEDYRHATMAVLRVAFLSAFTLEFFTTVGTAVVAVIIGFRLLSGTLALVDGLFVLLVAPEFYLPFRTLGLSYHARMQGIAAAEKLAPLLTADDLPKQRPLSAAVPAGALAVAFEGVTFRHGSNRGGVTAVDLLLPAGSVTALVGESGAGKSTLAGLLLALTMPEEGRVTVNGIDIGRFIPAEWHQRLAWIPQKPFFFCGTLRENLAIGLPSCSDTDIYAALDAAAALSFVQQLPGALDYQLGDRGAGLSGGELCRLAITRVLLRRAGLVILDEPTAGLDRDNEQLVTASLAKLAEGRTLLLISHREDTVSLADRVVRLVDGRIEQSEIAAAGSSRKEDGMKDLLTILAVARSRWKWMAAGVLLAVAVVAANALLMAVSGWFITAMAVAGVSKISFNYFAPSAAIRALAISRTVGRYLERLVTHGAAFRILSELRVWLFRKLVPLSPGLLEGYASGELAGRLRSDIDALETLYLRIIAPLATGVVTICAATLFVACWSSSAALVLFIALAVPGFVLPLFARWRAEPHGRKATALAGELRTAITDGITGGAELLLLGAVEKHVAAVDDLSARLVEEQDSLAAVNAGNLAALLLSAGAAGAALLLVCAAQVRTGELTGPQLVMLLLFAAAVFEAAGGMPAALQLLPAAAASAGRITELSAAEPPSAEPTSPLALPDSFAISMQNVSVSYDGDRQVLSDFNLELPPCSRVALTGDSGCGKSTVAGVLLRFRDYRGSITLGGRELKSLAADDLRLLIAALPQKPHIFNTTIRENILLADPQASAAAIDAVLHDAMLDEWVAGLPDGLDTRVGEGGSAVSGGEARRIAVARTLLKDAPLVILDEPTEGLDSETERRLLERLDSRLTGKTLLVITHRPAPLAIVDRVVRMGGAVDKPVS